MRCPTFDEVVKWRLCGRTSVILDGAYYYAHLRWRKNTVRHHIWDLVLIPLRRFFSTPGKWKQPLLGSIWWMAYSFIGDTASFEEGYLRAWYECLASEAPVTWINIFVGNRSLYVPILYDKVNQNIGNDRQIFETLRMWYSWLQLTRGFGEVVLPRRLTRIEKVGVRTTCS